MWFRRNIRKSSTSEEITRLRLGEWQPFKWSSTIESNHWGKYLFLFFGLCLTAITRIDCILPEDQATTELDLTSLSAQQGDLAIHWSHNLPSHSMKLLLGSDHKPGTSFLDPFVTRCHCSCLQSQWWVLFLFRVHEEEGAFSLLATGGRNWWWVLLVVEPQREKAVTLSDHVVVESFPPTNNTHFRTPVYCHVSKK